jgi:hypothetical protein
VGNSLKISSNQTQPVNVKTFKPEFLFSPSFKLNHVEFNLISSNQFGWSKGKVETLFDYKK